MGARLPRNNQPSFSHRQLQTACADTVTVEQPSAALLPSVLIRTHTCRSLFHAMYVDNYQTAEEQSTCLFCRSCLYPPHTAAACVSLITHSLPMSLTLRALTYSYIEKIYHRHENAQQQDSNKTQHAHAPLIGTHLTPHVLHLVRTAYHPSRVLSACNGRGN